MKTRLPLIAVLLVVSGFSQAVAISGDQQAVDVGAEQHPKPLPDSVLVAWKQAGAEVGWIGLDRLGFEDHRPVDSKQAELPAFRFREFNAEVVGRLPHPVRAFGMDLTGAKVTDAGLKELVGLKSLQILILGDAEVTDDGLKELADLKGLQTLILGDTQVTGGGLTELQKKLPRCEILH
jgi:internalin A